MGSVGIANALVILFADVTPDDPQVKTATVPFAQLKQTTCPYCGVGCGVDIEFDANQPVALAGTPEHPANFGRLCVKGSHLLDTVDTAGRLLYPYIGSQRASWDDAIAHVAERFTEIIRRHGPDSVAFYVSGQLLTEDYYVANKLMKGYIGSANIDTNSRLCMSSAVSAYKRAFGEDVVPCDYEDLEHTDYLVLVGSNTAWAHPVLFQRIQRAKLKNPRMQVIVIDPRKTETCSIADQHLRLKIGTDAALYNGLLNYIQQQGYVDHNFVDQHTEQFDEAIAACSTWPIEQVATYCGVAAADIESFYAGFCAANRAITFYSMGVNQSSSGVDKANSIINVHLATGKLLTQGSGPFSITGQPNAMGGREVGGLANMLAAHMDIEDPQARDRVKRFWNSPTICAAPGYKAVDMFDAIAAGTIKAVWVMATNPMVSLPNRNRIEQALKQCDFVVVSDCVAKNDTLNFADVKLPATGWFEKDGTVTNSERRISRQRGMVLPSGVAKHDWQIICSIAQKMGFSGFDYQHPAEIFNEHARLTALENDGSRQLNLAGLTQLTIDEYDALEPVMWPVLARPKNLRPAKQAEPQQAASVFPGYQFSTSSKKARFIAIIPRLPESKTCDQYPLMLNSGRVRDQWHTMTRTGKASALNAHIEQPTITIHPQDAQRFSVYREGLVDVTSCYGQLTLNLKISDEVCAGECFIPIHWNAQFASSANVSKLYSSVVDPISGQPESKAVAVNIAPKTFSCYATLILASEYPLDTVTVACDFWVYTPLYKGSKVQLAFERLPSILDWCQAVVPQSLEWLVWQQGSQTHVTGFANGVIQCLVFFDEQLVNLPADWCEHLLTVDPADTNSLQSLLYCQPSPEFTQGALVCSCFKVREQSIIEAIERGVNTVSELGGALKCGTNCGSCKPRLVQLIEERT